MDWIEKFFGLSPDGGDGTTEAAIVFAAVIVLGLVIIMRMPSLRTRLRTMFETKKTR
jgi:hypothetical protein